MFGPVSAKDHETILDVIALGGLVLGLLMILILGVDAALANAGAFAIYAGVVILLYQLIWHFLPVRCNRPGCPGFMRRADSAVSDGYWVRYICDWGPHVIERFITPDPDAPTDSFTS